MFLHLQSFQWMWLNVAVLLGGGSVPSVEELMRQAVPAWLEYERRADHFTGDVDYVEETGIGRSDGARTENGRIRVQVAPLYRLFHITAESASPDGKRAYNEEVLGHNTKYRFRLSRSSKERDLVVKELEQTPQLSLTTGVHYFRERQLTLQLVRLNLGHLSDLFASGAIQVRAIERVDFAGEPLIKVHFENTKVPGGPRSESMRSGYILLDPARDWICRVVDGERFNSAAEIARVHSRTVRTCQQDSSGTWLPKEVVSETRWELTNGEVLRSRYTAQYRLRVDRSSQEWQCTLSAFGLPEPYGVEWERPTPWWLYALISAGVLFVVAVIVSFWKRRLAARQSA